MSKELKEIIGKITDDFIKENKEFKENLKSMTSKQIFELYDKIVENEDPYDKWWYNVYMNCDCITYADPNGYYGCRKIGLCMYEECPKKEK